MMIVRSSPSRSSRTGRRTYLAMDTAKFCEADQTVALRPASAKDFSSIFQNFC
jgi:hypothetical protein